MNYFFHDHLNIWCDNITTLTETKGLSLRYFHVFWNIFMHFFMLLLVCNLIYAFYLIASLNIECGHHTHQHFTQE
jgi:hypothetical protein